jgi:6,7-dimethyl-8-ribityllumazine synthase
LAEKVIKLAILVSEFNYDITYLMLQRALEHADFLEAKVTYIYRVPGAFDMPIAIKALLEQDDVEAVVALGAVLEGETQHDEIVAQHCARKIVDLAVQYGKPVTLGVSGPGMTRLQGEERIDEYAKRAVESAVKLVKRSQKFSDVMKSGKEQYPLIIA